VSVPEVSKVMEVTEVGEVVARKERAMMERVGRAAMDTAKALHTTSAVHTAEAVASHATHHRVGRHHWCGKHRRHDSTSNRNFAEHDNPPGRLPPRKL
jgi:hypothetical protein